MNRNQKKWKKKPKQTQKLHPFTYLIIYQIESYFKNSMFHWEQDTYFANTRFEQKTVERVFSLHPQMEKKNPWTASLNPPIVKTFVGT